MTIDNIGASGPTTPVRQYSGQYLSKNRLSKAARARIAADIVSGKADVHDLCIKQVARLCRVPLSALNIARNGSRPQRTETLAQHLARSTPDERAEAARVIGVDKVWDQMVAPLITAPNNGGMS
jgi:hypothetical protein